MWFWFPCKKNSFVKAREEFPTYANALAESLPAKLVESTMNGIFISHREDDTKTWALLLRNELVGTFGA